MTVKLVYDWTDELICVANSWKSAIDFLIKSKNINGEDEIGYREEKCYIESTVEKYFGENWETTIKNIEPQYFKKCFGDTFRIEDKEIYTVE